MTRATILAATDRMWIKGRKLCSLLSPQLMLVINLLAVCHVACTKLYFKMTEAHVCGQLAQSCNETRDLYEHYAVTPLVQRQTSRK